MNMRLFDSHAHYDDARFDGETERILAEVHASGVEKITNIASSLATSRARRIFGLVWNICRRKLMLTNTALIFLVT